MQKVLRGSLVGLILLAAAGCATHGRTYPTPEAAMAAVADVAGKGDQQAVDEIFGAGATGVLWSGDPVSDRADGEIVRQMILDRVEVSEDGGRALVSIGDDDWPFPIPLVKVHDGWRFDLDAGEQEMLNRRVGRNELRTIATMHAYVDAQREYAAVGRDGNPPAFAQRFRSRPGMHGGLYWATGADDAESPLGPLVAEAVVQGYSTTDDGPRPFHGYYYRILTAQGPHAPGGAERYVDEQGLMTGGFAAVAWPATWGNSGVMTFIVSDLGIVYQKDLGRDTAKAAGAITSFDPDDAWGPAYEE